MGTKPVEYASRAPQRSWLTAITLLPFPWAAAGVSLWALRATQSPDGLVPAVLALDAVVLASLYERFSALAPSDALVVEGGVSGFALLVEFLAVQSFWSAGRSVLPVLIIMCLTVAFGGSCLYATACRLSGLSRKGQSVL